MSIDKNFFTFGHRGKQEGVDENTLEAFRKTLELGISAIEYDVHSTDKEPVVIHDTKVDRTTNGTGYICDLDFDYLRSLSTPLGGRIPTLREVIDVVGKMANETHAPRALQNIELKSRGSAKQVAEVLAEYLKKDWVSDNFLVSSFRHPELKIFKKLIPSIRIGVLSNVYPIDGVLYFKRFDAWSVHLEDEITDQRIVDELLENGFNVGVWTVREQGVDVDYFKKMGVNFVF